MPAALVNFQLSANEDFTSPLITVQNPDGTPRNFSGVQLRLQVRPCQGGPGSPLLDLSIGAGITVVNPSGGVIQFSVARFAVAAGTHVQDLVEEHAGYRTQIFAGEFIVHDGVTRWT